MEKNITAYRSKYNLGAVTIFQKKIATEAMNTP
jgi:hypothetical protein